jgi:hypothetical protein
MSGMRTIGGSQRRSDSKRKEKNLLGVFLIQCCIQGLLKKAADEGSPMEEMVDILELTHQKDCDKSTSKMVDWMLQQGLIPQGKKRATSEQFYFAHKKLPRESVNGMC